MRKKSGEIGDRTAWKLYVLSLLPTYKLKASNWLLSAQSGSVKKFDNKITHFTFNSTDTDNWLNFAQFCDSRHYLFKPQ